MIDVTKVDTKDLICKLATAVFEQALYDVCKSPREYPVDITARQISCCDLIQYATGLEPELIEKNFIARARERMEKGGRKYVKTN